MTLSTAQMVLMSRLLDEVLPLDEAGRRRWLDNLSPEYEDLAPALREVLLPTRGLETLSTLPKLESADEPSSLPASALHPGARIGPYELIRLLGSGGMAEVWLARPAVGGFKREVALKLPLLTRMRKDLAQRFARERDILATLEHPHIARLYDAGIDAAGLPYLAMEYVRGEPLTSWCDARTLGIRERLALFLQILEAVRYAHQKQVIHRDLKPSNVLVTDSGEARLLDFGVAKLLETQAPEELQLTGLYGRAFTPEYASPELLRGAPVDVRSDVYSLGVLLYELLAGTRPYKWKASPSLGLLEQEIVTTEPKRPSTQLDQVAAAARGTTREKLARLLQGDLDVITLKALAKEPGERYGRATDLAEDLTRHLESRPIEARPARIPYRLKKFVHRNRWRVVVGTATLATVLIPLAVEIHRTSTDPLAAVLAEPSQPLGPKSVAVLPFSDMSERKDQQYLSEGLADETINSLARFTDLQVIARTSSFYFKDKPATTGQIAKVLGVSNILEGSVRTTGNTIRVNVELIRARSGLRLWSAAYDRHLETLATLQSEIANAIAATLGAAPANASPGPDQKENTYLLLLKANYFYERFGDGDLKRAVDQYQQALSLDPDNSLAWAKLARVYIWQGKARELTASQARSMAYAAIQRALAIDPSSQTAHRWLGRLYVEYDWDWPAAQTQFERAIAVNPNSQDGLLAGEDLGELTGVTTGRFERSLQVEHELLARNPLDINRLYELAYIQQQSGRFEASAATFQRLLELSPTYMHAQADYAETLALQHRFDNALAAAQMETNAAARAWALSLVYWGLGRKNDSDTELRHIESSFGASEAFEVATLHAYRNEPDAAIAWLERAHQQRDVMLVGIKSDPLLISLHGDPRYQALLRNLNLTP